MSLQDHYNAKPGRMGRVYGGVGMAMAGPPGVRDIYRILKLDFAWAGLVYRNLGTRSSGRIPAAGKGGLMEAWERDPKKFRQKVREGAWRGPTAGMCPGYAQANLIILPKDAAADFLLFCQRNRKACPLLEIGAAGDPVLKDVAPGADLRIDLPAYQVFKSGELVEERENLVGLWQDDLVAFLLGCTYTFAEALSQAGFCPPGPGEEPGSCVYATDLPAEAAGPFAGPLLVLAGAVPKTRLAEAVLITSRQRKAFGAPVHVGDPAAIGIKDLSRPQSGNKGLAPGPGEVAVFWVCGETAQAAVMRAKVPLVIKNKPGHLFVTDLPVGQAVGSTQPD